MSNRRPAAARLGWRDTWVVGVLPDEGSGGHRQNTADLDLALFTGMGKARNVINVLSADLVVVCGGGGR